MDMDKIVARRTQLMCRQYANTHVIKPLNSFERLVMQQFLQKTGATIERTETQTNCILGTNTYCLLH
jgi:hypothetical protein